MLQLKLWGARRYAQLGRPISHYMYLF
jgi:hypothetical protein